MKILDHRQNLAQFLSGLHDSEVTIVTAFAAKTEPVIETLPANDDDPAYAEGEAVLTMRSDGAYITFCTFDRVIYHRKKWWLCRVKGKQTQAPFKLTPGLKRAIKGKAEDWYNSEKSYLDSQDLRELADQLQAMP